MAGFNNDEFNAHEDEHCRDLEKFGQMVREAGYHVPGETELPELNPDGSLVEPDEPTEPDDD